MDAVTRGGIAGLLGSAADTALHLLGLLLLRTSTTAHYIAQLIFPSQPVTPVRYAYGMFTHFLAGLLVGVLFALLLERFGYGQAYWKGLGYGGAFWLVHVAVIPNLVSPRPYLYRTELEALVDLLAHLAFGALAAWYLLRTAPVNAA